MERPWVYRVVAYSLLTLVAFVFLTPSVAGWVGKDDRLPGWMKKHIQKKILLGLDLQGGLHLVYEVQVDKAVSDKTDRLAADIEEKLRKEKKVRDVRVERTGQGEIFIAFKNPQDLYKLDKEFLRDYRKYLYEDNRNPAKGEIRFKIDSDYVEELRDYAVRQGVE